MRFAQLIDCRRGVGTIADLLLPSTRETHALLLLLPLSLLMFCVTASTHARCSSFLAALQSFWLKVQSLSRYCNTSQCSALTSGVADMQVMSTLAGSHSSTARMRQLAQAEVDWTCFRSAVEPGTITCTNQATDSLHLPDLPKSPSSLSLAGCSPRATSAADFSPRSGYSLCSPGSPRSQDRPYTTPTVVSPQPFRSGTECPLFVSSLYLSNQRAKSGTQTSLYADFARSMAEEGSSWSGPLHGSSVPPMPFLKSKSGGVALTFGNRQRDRPDRGSSQIAAEFPHKGSRRSHSTSELITVMREGGRPVKEPKALGSLIVRRSNAWPESSEGHPVGSGLTVRQQACLLGKCTLAKHEEKLAEKYGLWLQDLQCVWSCSPAGVHIPTAQADTAVTNADDALAPKLHSMGPI